MMNLTPHSIVIRAEDGTETVLAPSGRVARVSTTEEVVGSINGVPVVRRVARVSTTEEVVGSINGVPVVRRVFGAVEGLPEDDTPCVVSALVLAAVPGRPNTYAPDTGATAVRDKHGHVVAVTQLVAA